MRKLLMVSLFLGLMVSIAFAQALIGAKAAGMGGAGVANVTDLAAAYYNPAALMQSGVKAAEMKIALGAAYSQPDKLMEAISKTTDPAKLLLDNYSNNLSFTGNLNGVVGLNVKNIGLSILPFLRVDVNKPANSVGGSVSGIGRYNGVLTLGTSLSLPGFPFGSLALGLNAKTITAYKGSIIANASLADPQKSSGVKTIDSGSGMGFDLGVLTSIDLPMVSNFRVGLALRDLATSIKYSPKTQNAYIDQTTGQITTDAEVPGADYTVTEDSSTVLGASAVIPGIGATLAGDIEMIKSDTNLHLGIEYPMLMGALLLRAGFASGPNLSLTTIGTKINLPIFTLDAALISNAKNPDLNSAVVDINLGF